MKVGKRRNFDIELMLRRMSRIRHLNPDGTISMQGFGSLDEYESYLRTAIEIEGKTDAFVRKVIKKAMHAEQNLSEPSFINYCKDIARELDSTQKKDFKVLFPIWGSIAQLSGRRKWDEVTMSFDIRKDTRFAAKALEGRRNQVDRFQINTMRDLQDLPIARVRTHSQ